MLLWSTGRRLERWVTVPQGVVTYIPFATRISPDVDRAAAQQLRWPRYYGLLPDEASEQRHLQSRYAELAGRFYPTASGDELDLGVDQMSWFFIFDDQFDGVWGQSASWAKRLTSAVNQALQAPADLGLTHPLPLVRAFADLWIRSCDGMSADWRIRATANWRAYLDGHVTEAIYRSRAFDPSQAEHLVVRSHTAGAQPILDLAERLGYYEAPARLHDSAMMTTMRLIASEIVVLDNDIVSVEKEEAVGDDNLVLHIEREMGCTRDGAIDVICGMIRERAERFLDLEERLPWLGSYLALNPAERHALERFRTDALHTVMRGAHDWQQRSHRYASPHRVAAPRRRTASPHRAGQPAQRPDPAASKAR